MSHKVIHFCLEHRSCVGITVVAVNFLALFANKIDANQASWEEHSYTYGN
jgi:hypothetical protein